MGSLLGWQSDGDWSGWGLARTLLLPHGLSVEASLGFLTAWHSGLNGYLVWGLASSRSTIQRQSGRCNVAFFFNLSLEVTWCHFCCTSLVKQSPKADLISRGGPRSFSVEGISDVKGFVDMI